MSLPEYSLKNKKVVWFFLFVLLAGGALGFVTLGKKEDSTFVIKSASLVCTYPGATPLEVEQLISEPIEREVQSMRLVHKITSESYYGLSKIMVELDPATGAAEIPQLWDELRRKVLNIQSRLPAGASPVTVADDFGDVYGIYYGLSVDGGFTWSELREWAQRIKTALVTVDGVQKVTLFGEQTPVVNVYVSLAALANFSIRPESIVRTIGQQNTIVNSGEKQAGALEIQILEDGAYKDLGDISNQLLISSSGKQYRLGDIARVERGYADPPQTLMRVNGRRAVRVKEWYFDSRRAQSQMTVEEYYARLEELASGYYIQKVIVDPSAASFIETIRRHRKFLVREAENDVVNGIRVTASLLAAGMVQVMDVCRDCRREFGLYRWADEKLDRDTVIKENDHAMDDLRYFCATILSREFRWVDWRKR